MEFLRAQNISAAIVSLIERGARAARVRSKMCEVLRWVRDPALVQSTGALRAAVQSCGDCWQAMRALPRGAARRVRCLARLCNAVSPRVRANCCRGTKRARSVRATSPSACARLRPPAPGADGSDAPPSITCRGSVCTSFPNHMDTDRCAQPCFPRAWRAPPPAPHSDRRDS